MHKEERPKLSTEVEFLTALRKQIQAATVNENFEAVRAGIFEYLKIVARNPNEKSRLLVKLLGTYLSQENLAQVSQVEIWNQFKSDVVKSEIQIERSDVEKLESYFKLLSLNLMLDNLDNAIQLASMLRKDFQRNDLAYSVIQPWIHGSHENHPHLNTTLLPILTARRMWSDAENVAQRLMKYAPKVDGSLKYALPAYVGYLLTVFEDTGDLDYLTEVETILAIMELTKMEHSFLMSCISRYQRIVGDLDDAMISRREARDAELASNRQRNLSPSASKFLENSTSGKEFLTWINEVSKETKLEQASKSRYSFSDSQNVEVGFNETGFDSEGYDYTGFNEVGLDRHNFDRNGKLFDPAEFGDQEDPAESARLEEELFEAGLLYERDGYNKDGFEGSGGR